jgi:hypothetical protein
MRCHNLEDNVQKFIQKKPWYSSAYPEILAGDLTHKLIEQKEI